MYVGNIKWIWIALLKHREIQENPEDLLNLIMKLNNCGSGVKVNDGMVE